MNYNNFSLFYKRLLPVIISAMIILLISLFILSYSSYVTTDYYYANPTCINFTDYPPSTTYVNEILVGVLLYQIFVIGALFVTLINLKREKSKHIKTLGIITSFILLSLMIWWFLHFYYRGFYIVDGTYSRRDVCGNYVYSWTYNNSAKQLIWLFLPNIFIISLAFILNLIHSFLAPKNSKKIQKIKSKASKIATNKIRDLKKLLDEGIISKEVFDEKSKKYIEEL